MHLSLELEFNEEAEGELTWRYEPVPETLFAKVGHDDPVS